MPLAYIGPAPTAPEDIARQSDVATALDAQTHAAADITSGTLADERVSESSVTQHESALTITEDQIGDLGDYASTAYVDTSSAAQGYAVDRTGAAYTLLAADIGRTVLVDAAVTLPVLAPEFVRARVDIVNVSGGDLTPSTAANVTLIGAALIEPTAAASFLLTVAAGGAATWLAIGGRA